MILLEILVGLVLALGLYTALYSARIERAYPPSGGFVEVDGALIHYVEAAPADHQGAPIVLVHGASGNAGDMVASLMPELSRRHRVVAFDRPGHGWSERPSNGDVSDPSVQARILHEAAAKIGLEKPVLLGHSWGGAVATAWALDFPDDLSGLLVLSGATHPWEGEVAWYHRIVTTPVIGSIFLGLLALPGGLLLARASVAGVFAPDTAPEGYAERIGLPLLFRPRHFRANSTDSSRLREHLVTQSQHYQDIRVPTIIITGNRDKVVWAKLHSYALHGQIAGSELIKLVGVGHMPHYVRADVVIDALERLARRESPRAGTHVVEPEAPAALF
ncbi:alpha/beta hydrolase [Parvibaculum sp.]|uniref:alpha/beta fold hydrolase n=1 Tax=Parvibaculum sp. TaxID=2024848 RepID=UPI00320CFF28